MIQAIDRARRKRRKGGYRAATTQTTHHHVPQGRRPSHHITAQRKRDEGSETTRVGARCLHGNLVAWPHESSSRYKSPVSETLNSYVELGQIATKLPTSRGSVKSAAAWMYLTDRHVIGRCYTSAGLRVIRQCHRASTEQASFMKSTLAGRSDSRPASRRQLRGNTE